MNQPWTHLKNIILDTLLLTLDESDHFFLLEAASSPGLLDTTVLWASFSFSALFLSFRDSPFLVWPQNIGMSRGGARILCLLFLCTVPQRSHLTLWFETLSESLATLNSPSKFSSYIYPTVCFTSSFPFISLLYPLAFCFLISLTNTYGCTWQ